MTHAELMTCISVALSHYKAKKSDKPTVKDVRKINTAISELVFDTFLSDK